MQVPNDFYPFLQIVLFVMAGFGVFCMIAFISVQPAYKKDRKEQEANRKKAEKVTLADAAPVPASTISQHLITIEADEYFSLRNKDLLQDHPNDVINAVIAGLIEKMTPDIVKYMRVTMRDNEKLNERIFHGVLKVLAVDLPVNEVQRSTEKVQEIKEKPKEN